MEKPPTIVIEAGADIAMVGLWDVDPERAPFERHPSIAELESEAGAARLFLLLAVGPAEGEVNWVP